MVGVLLGVYLAELRFDAGQIGAIVGAGLAGAAVATLVATIGSERLGRRRLLVALSVLAAAGGIAIALPGTALTVGSLAFLGMVNGMGRDRGAWLVTEQAILPATTRDDERTRAFAWYNVLQDAGHACGGLLAGLPVLLRRSAGLGQVASFRAALVAYALLFLATAILYLRLSPAIERVGRGERDGGGAGDAEGAAASRDKAPRSARPPLSPESRRILWRISALFALDSLGGGFLTTALLSFFFHERFGAGVGTIGALFFGARVANAFSHLGAAWLAKRIGLVNTMVFTHIPSSLLLVTVAFAPSFPVAAALFLLREGLVEMDVPTRQSYVMAVVRPEERTVAAGVTHLVRMGAWAVAPSFAGLFMRGGSLALPLIVGAGMKVVYDVLLYAAFRGQRAPEEIARAQRVEKTGAG